MHLRKTEGTVGVSDGEGKDITAKDNLGLYSGYQVGTQAESYAWIDLDSVKLTKLDQDSEIEIKKENKRLEIEVLSGSLFFNVTEPLGEDETMEIRTSSMMVGIRGTCGWVKVLDQYNTMVYVLEGTVWCTITDPVSGRPVMVAEGESIAALFPKDHCPRPSDLSDPAAGLARLGTGAWRTRFRLLPYRSVGVDRGLLLAVRTDLLELDGQRQGPVLVALSPTPVSDGGGYRALIGPLDVRGV